MSGNLLSLHADEPPSTVGIAGTSGAEALAAVRPRRAGPVARGAIQDVIALQFDVATPLEAGLVLYVVHRRWVKECSVWRRQNVPLRNIWSLEVV